MTAPTAEPLHLQLGTALNPPNLDRELALEYALKFHRDTDSDDPRTVVETAGTFLTFLQGNT